MQTALSKGINIWCCYYWLQCYTEFIMDFWLLKKGQWNLAIPRIVLERDCFSWMGPDKAPVALKRSFPCLTEVELVMRTESHSESSSQQMQWWVTIDESAVNKTCVHGISAFVIFPKGCSMQRHCPRDLMNLRKTEKADTPLCKILLVPTVAHTVDLARHTCFNNSDVNAVCHRFPHNCIFAKFVID